MTTTATRATLAADPPESEPPAGARAKWRFWRSPADQPGWARPALLGVAAVATVLYAWSLPANGFAAYYSSAVKSMASSWEALFFGAFDPNATIALDKLPGAFVPQAVSVWLFGPYPWAMALPQVIYGLVCVLVMYRVVRLWAGPKAGLLAAVIFAFAPLLISMFGHPMEDGALTVCTVLAVDACQRAIRSGRLRPLLLAGFWVGVGFQAKMLQSWVVLPALAIAYLLAAKVRPGRRVKHLLAAFAITVAVSFSWTAAMSLAPADSRPYADGTTNNSVWSMVVGYNGLERFGIHVPGSVSTLGDTAQQQNPSSSDEQALTPEQGELLMLRYLTQLAWLLPLLLMSLGYGLSRWRRQDRLRNAGYAMWTTWFVVHAVVFGVVGIPHTAYLAALIPAVAALCAVGTQEAWRAYVARRKGTRWVLPVTLLVQGLVAAGLAGVADYLPVLVPAILVLTAGSVVALVVGLFRRLSRKLLTRGLAAGLAAALVAPVAWSFSVLDQRNGGTAFEAEAGPIGPKASAAFEELMVNFVGQPAVNAIQDVPPELTVPQRQLLDYVNEHRDGARFPFVTDSWVVASRYLIATDESPLAMAGFAGSSPFPSLAEAKELVATDQVRFFVLTGVYGMGDGNPSDESEAIASWVRDTCREVPQDTYRPGGAKIPVTDPTAEAVLYKC